MTWIDPLSRRLHRSAGQHGPLILMYHSVVPGKGTPDWRWAVSMQRFRDQLDFLAAEGYAMPTVAELVAVPVEKWRGRAAVITFDDGYEDNLAACEALQERGMRATWFIVSGSIGRQAKWAEDGRPKGRLLSASELRNMQHAAMEIGSHAVNHIRLTDIDNAHLMRELTDSKATLEDALGSCVHSFAYPYGCWDARCAEAVKKAGYAAGCTTRSGWALRDQNPYTLRRLTIFNTDTVNTLARKLYFADNEVGWAKLARYAFRRLIGN